ncbi:cytochrome P450 9Z1 [Tribolium castaneum]|uniref:Cytochrome P450 9Z1 n=2 Tax=Tribolium castaneum TaxID=7070 RepID=D6WWU1_TRICA|nr:cytochrome P450 9Z1 [Tribolium castaneum]
MAPNSRYCGMYQFTMPTLVVRDPDLIKQITVKDFDYFLNHRTFIPEECDALWGKNLFALTNQKWRDMRSTLSPAFTGSKMKFMFPLISETAEYFIRHFLSKQEDVVTVEMKDAFTRFTNDVIANTAFGVSCDSLKERENEFYLMGKEATDLKGFWKNIKLLLFFLIPQVFKLCKVRFFSKSVANFFTNLIKGNITKREEFGIVRPDMIYLLMEARKNVSNEPISDEDITAQALIFFFAGFDTVSSAMCFMSYELATNPEIQEKLLQEIDSVEGKPTYDTLMNLKYLDMVVSETLRKWPISVATDRICNKPYTIEPKSPDKRPLLLEKNLAVWIPVYALHRDPNYFPDPNRFDPERFNEENKANIKPYTYLPFGLGPRNCIGSRFALLEMKILFFYILSHFEITPIPRTQIPLKINKTQFALTAEDGFWLGLKRRQK